MMASFKCKNCGGQMDLSGTSGIECPYCGSKVFFSDADFKNHEEFRQRLLQYYKAEAAKKKAQAKKQKKEQEAKLTKAEKKAIKAQKRAKMPPVPDMIPLFLQVLKTFFSGFLGKFHFRVVRIKIGVGSADAATTAMIYSGICTAMKPVFKFLDKHSNLHGMKTAEIDVYPDFLSDSITADVKMSFSMSIGGLLGVVFKTAFKFLFGWIKITPKSTSNLPSKASETSNKTSGNAANEQKKA